VANVSPPPPPNPQRGFIAELAHKLLDWLDKPWKAFAVAGLAVLAGLGYGGWLSRDALIDAWKMSSGRPILKRSELPNLLKMLQNETKADIVGIWTLRLEANAMNFEIAVGKDGKPWDFEPHRLPAIRSPVSEPRGLAEIMAGQIICRSPVGSHTNGDLFARRMVEEGVNRTCLVPIPPAPNILVGVLIIAWKKEPDRSTEEAALGLARETASIMVSRWE
jgi:hypothetical protein